MAVPTFVQAANGGVATTGNFTAFLNSVGVGNVIIVQILQDGTGSVPTLSSITNIQALDGTASSMTSLASTQDVGSAAAARQHLWIGRATANNPSCNIDTPGDDIYGWMTEFSGVSTGTTLASVIENGAGTFTNGAGTSATIADTGVTTNGSDRLALNFIGVNDDNNADFDTEAFTGQTGGTWVSGGSFGSATGTDGAVGIQKADMAAAGTINGGSLTMAASDAWGVIGFALISPSTGGIAQGDQSQPLLMNLSRR